LILARIGPVTASAGTSKTRAAVTEWKSMPDRNASMSPASSDMCAMIRISIWL
jgi:hypothetical protein